MLQLLKVKNFALINDAEINFEKGFSAITGETGSGKSILLDALGFLLGRRADTSFIGLKSDKCIIEGKFHIAPYQFQNLFEINDWDHYDETIIRREINSNGRSRAFVNDTPVLLSDLKSFGDLLVDIHGQHSVQLLQSKEFYFNLIDGISNAFDVRNVYQEFFIKYQKINKEIEELEHQINNQKAETEFKAYKFEELKKLDLKKGEQEELEEEFENLNRTDEIKSVLGAISEELNDQDFSVVQTLQKNVEGVGKISSINEQYSELKERLNSALIEIKDIAEEANNISRNLSSDTERLEWVDVRLSELFAAVKKYAVKDADDLLEMYDALANELEGDGNAEEQLKLKQIERDKITVQLAEQSNQLNQKRSKGTKVLIDEVLHNLTGLNMQNAQLKVELMPSDFNKYGNVEIAFLFNANKGGKLEKLSKVASGGEMSRLMLVFKKILSKYIALPTIIFDEIDAGVSGDVASKMAEMMKSMSNTLQLISITHLPQMAASSQHHYQVWKDHNEKTTTSFIKQLNQTERISAIAQMLSGSKITEAAIDNAKSMLAEQ